jgi:hypothetical protein
MGAGQGSTSLARSLLRITSRLPFAHYWEGQTNPQLELDVDRKTPFSERDRMVS